MLSGLSDKRASPGQCELLAYMQDTHCLFWHQGWTLQLLQIRKTCFAICAQRKRSATTTTITTNPFVSIITISAPLFWAQRWIVNSKNVQTLYRKSWLFFLLVHRWEYVKKQWNLVSFWLYITSAYTYLL